MCVERDSESRLLKVVECYGRLWRPGEPLSGIERLNGCGGLEGQLRAVESCWLEDCVYCGASSKAI